jgi:RHS repeat-associated protein
MPNGVTRTVVYDPHRDLPVSVTHTNPAGTILAQRTYSYDSVNRLTERTQLRAGAVSRPDAFDYNERSELSAALLGTNGYAYAFDSIGNRQTAVENAITNAYLSNPLNQYTNILRASAPPREDIPVFDYDGNQTLLRTTTGSWQVEYNAENRPVLFSNETAVITMVYDYQGRRTEMKVIQSGSTTRHERYLYRGYLQLAALNLLDVTNVIHAITWEPTEPVATRPLGIHLEGQGEGMYTYSFDQVKNVTELFDSTGALAATYDYAPFGALTFATGPAADLNPLTFSSEIHDAPLGLIYYNFRHLNVLDARWVNRDPLGERGGVNVYVLAENNAVDRIDYLGLEWQGPYRQHDRRAIVEADCGDSVRGIESLVPYDLREFGKWLKREDQGSWPIASIDEKFLEKRKFSVPNVVYIVRGPEDNWVAEGINIYADNAHMSNQRGVYYSLGFDVVIRQTMIWDEWKAALGSVNIHGLLYFGHGPEMRAWNDSRTISPYHDIKGGVHRPWLHHGLGFLNHHGCLGMKFNFAQWVSNRGLYRYHIGYTYALNALNGMTTIPGTYVPAP